VKVCNLNFLSVIVDGLFFFSLSLVLSLHQLLQFCLTSWVTQTHTQLTTVTDLTAGHRKAETW